MLEQPVETSVQDLPAPANNGVSFFLNERGGRGQGERQSGGERETQREGQRVMQSCCTE